MIEEGSSVVNRIILDHAFYLNAFRIAGARLGSVLLKERFFDTPFEVTKNGYEALQLLDLPFGKIQVVLSWINFELSLSQISAHYDTDLKLVNSKMICGNIALLDLRKICTLYMSGCQAVVGDLSALKACPNITDLNLSFTRLTGEYS